MDIRTLSLLIGPKSKLKILLSILLISFSFIVGSDLFSNCDRTYDLISSAEIVIDGDVAVAISDLIVHESQMVVFKLDTDVSQLFVAVAVS